MRARDDALDSTMADARPPTYNGDAAAPGGEILSIRSLEIDFEVTRGHRQAAVRGVDLALQPGRVLGVAGESGSGKSTIARAVMGLLPRHAQVRGSIRYHDDELVGLSEKRLRAYRGSKVAMVSQETAAALNPTLRIGAQMRLVLKAHRAAGRDDMQRRIVEALEAVQLRDLPRVLHSYPSELSGGMCQRVVIAMALACGSKVLLADEPTTALDVTVQGEIIRLLHRLVNERGLALMMISHDLAVLNEICDDLAVMYRGEIVERGAIGEILRRPAHPYTQGLRLSVPRMSNRGTDLPTLPMSDAEPVREGGCRFAPRCRWRTERCDEPQHLRRLELPSRAPRVVLCHRAEEINPEVVS